MAKFTSASNEELSENKVYFAKPKVTNLEIKIYLERLIAIFNIVMTKLQFTATIPSLLSHPRVIEILTREDYKQVVVAFGSLLRCLKNPEDTLSSKEYYGEWTSSSEVSVANEKECCSQKSDEPSDFPKMNIEVYKAIEILSSYPLIRQVVKQNSDNLSKPAVSFMRQLEYFMEFSISKTKLTPQEEVEKELHLRSVIKKFEQTGREISDLTNLLEEQKFRHQQESEEFLNEWNKYRDKWDEINQEFNDEYSKILQDSEENSSLSSENFAENMKGLRVLLEKTKENLENQKANNRKAETKVQGKKFKVESQFLAILTKYDTEIGERQAIYEELERQYSDLDKEKSQLMEEMEEQLNIYNKIITEREEKEFAVVREKYEKFINNRCARIIQRWWRGILEKKNKDKKKKKKKGKKKK